MPKPLMLFACVTLVFVIFSVQEGFVDAQVRTIGRNEVSNPTSTLACFFESWSVLRTGKKQFAVDLTDTSLCTHVVFCFAFLHSHTLTLTHPPDPKNSDELLNQLVALKTKAPTLSVTVAVGGWEEASYRLTRMVASAPRRKAFIDSVLVYLSRHRLDGLDVVWQSPADRMQGGVPEDKANLVQLCKELKEALKPLGYRFTVGIMSEKRVIDNGYDLAGIAQHVDAVYLLAYDYHGKWERKTGLNAPLYSRRGETGLELTDNVNFTVSYLIQKGVPPHKLILGLPMFGRVFFLADAANHHLGANSLEGDPSSSDGFLSYNEVCETFVSEGARWSLERHKEHRALYAYKGVSWISYDDSVSLTEKVDFAKALGLGGVFAFALGTDDFRGLCGGGKYPLLRAVNEAMRKGAPAQHKPEKPPVVACFLQGWSVYRPAPAKFTVNDVDTSLCTHVILSFVGIHNTTLTIVDLDPSYTTNGVYRDLFRLKWKNPSLVTTVAVGGYLEGSRKFSRMVATRHTRKTFIESVLEFLRNTLLDGIDLAWHDPTYRGSPLVDRENFALLCQELSAAFAENGYHLGVTVSGRRETLRQGYDLPAIGQAADLVHVILYNFFGAWDGRTSHTSPLYPRAGDNGEQSTYNMDSALRYVVEAGVPEEKVVANIAFFSGTYTLQNPVRSEYGAPSIGDGPKGPYTNSASFMAYNEVCELLRKEPGLWTTGWDPEHQVNYMHSKTSWIGFDNTTTVEERVRLTLRHGVHGVGVWAVDMDDFRGTCGNDAFPLLKAVNRVLGRRWSSPDPALLPRVTPRPNNDASCSVAPAKDVTIQVLSCGRQANGSCATEGRVPPETVVLAECWRTSHMVMRCSNDGLWKSNDNRDSADRIVSELCQPYYLNSQVCGRRPRYLRTLNLTSLYEMQNRWPWVAEILQDNASVCTGTLISPVYVLTAAHCVSRSQESSTLPIPASRLGVMVGEGASRPVEGVRIHPNYQTGSSPRNDIALIQLEEAIVFHSKMYPACVAHTELDPFKDSVAFNRQTVPQGSVKYEMAVLQASPDCVFAEASCPGRPQVLPSQFCAVTAAEFESLDLTVGSSGGPFLQDLPAGDVTEAWTVTGIVSSSSATTGCTVPLFTDVFHFRHWLADSVRALMQF